MGRLGFLLSAGAVLALPTLADAAPIKVLYSPAKADSALAMNQAINLALKNPAFSRQKKAGPDTLVLTVPQGQQAADGNSKDSIRFTLVFTRGSDRVGNSVELCTASPPFDCVKQIMSDIKSAAAIASTDMEF